MRDLHPDFAEKINDGTLMVVQLIACEFGPEPSYFWGGIGILQYGGRAYRGLDGAAYAQSISETQETQASSVELVVGLKKNDEDLGWLRTIRARGREVIITEAFLDPDTLELIATDVSFRGVAGDLQLRVAPDRYELTVTVANELEALKGYWGLSHSDADQQRLFPGDTSHRFIPFFQDIDFNI